jgi:segregation and condensation protein B
VEYLAQHIEALIFTTEHAVSIKEIKSCLEETFETKVNQNDIETAIATLQERYKEGDFAFELLEVAEGFQFMTKPAYHNIIGTYLKQTTKKRLSQAALETLSIIAYKQPISKGELESIRGVSCDYSIQKLLEKELVAIAGRSDAPGRPLLYSTSEKFMDYFGLKSLRDLPKTKDFAGTENTVGEAAPIEETVSKAEEVPSIAIDFDQIM